MCEDNPTTLSFKLRLLSWNYECDKKTQKNIIDTFYKLLCFVTLGNLSHNCHFLLVIQICPNYNDCMKEK